MFYTVLMAKHAFPYETAQAVCEISEQLAAAGA